eukprot:371071_1
MTQNLELTEKTDTDQNLTLIETRTDTECLNDTYQMIVKSSTIERHVLKDFLDKVTKHYKSMNESTTQEDDFTVNEDMVSSFTNLTAQSPKIKSLQIAFYPSGMTLIPSKNANDSDKEATIIPYTCITRIVCVPDKTKKNLMLSVWMNHKIALKWRKSSIDSFMLMFADSSAYEDDDEEENAYPAFVKAITQMTKLNIDREDKHFYKGTFGANVGVKTTVVYPLPSGILLTPKLRFVPRDKIKYYEYIRQGAGLKYWEIDVVLIDEEEEANAQTHDANHNTKATKKKRKKDYVISLNMIEKKECGAIDCYFKKMRIGLKHDDDDESSDDTDNKSPSPMEEDEAANEMDDSDDEEYKIEEDDYQYTDSSGDDEEEDGDCDMNTSTNDVHMEEANNDDQMSDSPLIIPSPKKKKKKRRKTTPKKRVMKAKQSRKRKRKD